VTSLVCERCGLHGHGAEPGDQCSHWWEHRRCPGRLVPEGSTGQRGVSAAVAAVARERNEAVALLRALVKRGEGCTVDPPCGGCFRCDAAAWVAAHPDEVDVDGHVDAKGVRYIGQAKRQPDGTWRALADIGGGLFLVECTVVLGEARAKATEPQVEER
jgi:hypothetical protein